MVPRKLLLALRFVLCLGLAAAWIIPVGHAHAVPAGEIEVEALLQKGNDLRRSGDDQAALPVFARAHELAPGPRTAVQLGLVEQALGRWADADLHLTTGLRAKQDPWILRNRDTIEEALGRVKHHVGRVEITGEPVGAEVLIGGRRVGHVPLAEPVRVSAGTVDVELRAPGYRPTLRTLMIAGGQYQPVVMRLERIGSPIGSLPEAVTDSPEASTSGLAGRATPFIKYGALGGAAIGLGVGIFAVARHSDLVGSFNGRGCVEDGGGMGVLNNGSYDTECATLAADYQNAKTLAIVGFVGAGAMVATAAILHFVGRPTEPERTSLGAGPVRCAPALGGRGLAGVACSGTY